VRGGDGAGKLAATVDADFARRRSVELEAQHAPALLNALVEAECPQTDSLRHRGGLSWQAISLQ
jgi:hypothetical protein